MTTEHHFVCLLGERSVQMFHHFNWIVFVLLLSLNFGFFIFCFLNSGYKSLLIYVIHKYFIQTEACLSLLLIVYFTEQKFLILMKCNLSIFFLSCVMCLVSYLKSYFQIQTKQIFYYVLGP